MSSKTTFKNSRRVLSVVMALMLSLCLVFSTMTTQASAATTADEGVDAVKNSILQIVMTYQPKNDNRIVMSSGTCFLINSTTAISAAHIFDPSINTEFNRFLKKTYGDNHVFDEKNIKGYQILVNGGVPVNATLRKINLIADYAIVKLDETVARPTVTLGHSSDMKVTQQIYALGFPEVVSDRQDSVTYTVDQASITSSTVSNIATTYGVDYIIHNATLSNGNSGGPLVDEKGNVIGVNVGGYSEGNNNDEDPNDRGEIVAYRAVAIDQVVALLDDLDIEYNRSDDPVVTPTEAETEAATEAVTEAPTEKAEDSTLAVGNVDDGNGMDMTKLIIIIAIAVLVVVVIVVVIIIIVSSKKKSAANATPVQRGTVPGPGVPPVGARPSQPPYGQQAPYGQQPAYRPTTPPSATVPSNEGAGETSVLNDGAGETTVLGNQSTGFTMIRKRNNEKININKPEFVIGKERRRVDYCISDNNSISRVHAKIKVRAGRCYIADLGSTNCTYVNGSKLSPNQEVILSKGDQIKVSDEEFEFLG